MNNVKMGPDPLLTSSYLRRAASVKMIFRGQATLYFNIMQSSRCGEENEKFGGMYFTSKLSLSMLESGRVRALDRMELSMTKFKSSAGHATWYIRSNNILVMFRPNSPSSRKK
jgi:hypothetical protein